MRRETKFSVDLVTTCFNMEWGCIKDIRFYRNFFGNGDIHELENALLGLRMDQNLSKALGNQNVECYLRGHNLSFHMK